MKKYFFAMLTGLLLCFSQATFAQCNSSIVGTPSQQGNNISATVSVVNPGNGVFVYQWYFDGSIIQPYSFVNHASATLQFSYPQTLCAAVYDTINHCTYYWCDTFYPVNCTLQTTIATNMGANGLVHTGVGATGQHGALYNDWYVDGHNILPIVHGNYDSVYLSNGVHQICVISHDSLCYDTACTQVVVTNCLITATLHDSIIPGTSVHYLLPHLNTSAGNNTFLWNTGATSDAIQVTASGNYCVTVTNSLEPCAAVACVTVPSCNVQVSIHDSLLYVSPPFHLLTASATSSAGSNTFVWSTGAVSSQITAVTSGNYCVTATNSLGCTATNCKIINPCALHAGIRDSLIPGTTTHLLSLTTGSGDYSDLRMQWSNGSTQPLIQVTTPGQYCITVRDTFTGCRDTACITISNCAFQLSIKDSVMTSSAHLLIPQFTSPGGTNTYHWSNGSTASEIMLTVGGTYCLTVTNSLGCSATACKGITICNSQVSITDTLIPGTTNHYLVTHVSPPGNYSYLWSPGTSTSPNLQVSNSGSYCVTVNLSGTNCTATACKSVSISACNGNFTAVVNCDTVRFYPSDTSVAGNWLFGDGSTGVMGVNAAHHFAPGVYNVTHYVNHYTPTFCVDTVHKSITVTACANDTICGVVFYDNNGNGIKDNGEQAPSGITVHAGSYFTATFLGSYELIVPSGTYSVWMTAPTGATFTIPVSSQQTGIYSVTVNGHSRHCGYNFGLINTSAHITGCVFVDANNNNILDAGEFRLPGVTVHVGAYTAYSGFSSYYSAAVPAGTYAVSYTPTGAYAGYTVSPTSQSVTVPAGGSASVNFALHLPAGSCNAAVSLVPHTTVTAAHPAWYNVYIHNYGSSAISGTMLFQYDPVLHLNYASPAQTSNNIAQHQLTFNYSNIQPGQYGSYWISFQADSVIAIGYPAFNLVTITANCNESTMADNTDTVHQAATSSWDPNNKIVTPEGKGVEGFISKNQELQYVINFQNTGTAPAVNVVLHDEISNHLDLNTLRVIGASHDYTMQLNGRELIATFSEILLPDSGSNEQASHGWLAFRIKPIAGISGGSVIDNQADIFFDYNEGVNTNSVRNTIEIALGVDDVVKAPVIQLSPNPFESFTNIKVFGVDDAPIDVLITDLCGRETMHVSGLPSEIIRIDRNGLSAGTYLYSVQQFGKIVAIGKLMAK
ncbi:MAG: hypothetical protein U0T73_10460 [Chitinophagales bacterium]